MQATAISSDAAPQRPSSQPQQSASPAKPSGPPKPHPNGVNDVKPRLTKEQHDILEKHFQQQHKPSTNTKRGFAEALGVPLDKINNWFQNRRAKVKQDFKKQLNQYNMSMGVYGQPPVPMMPPQFPQHGDSRGHLAIPQEYYPVSADHSPASIPVQSVEGPSALDLGPRMALQQQAFDMHHSLRSIPEADRPTAYNPNAVMNSFMAATAGAPYMQQNAVSLPPQDPTFSYETSNLYDGLPNDLSYPIPSSLNNSSAPSHAPFQFEDFGIDFSSLAANPSQGTDLQNSAGSISDEASPFSGAQSNATSQSSSLPNPSSVASITSMYSGWTDEPKSRPDAKSNNNSEDVFDSPYNLQQASVSDAALFAWNQNGHNHSFSQGDLYQHSNTSAQAVLSSPGRQHERTVSAGPSEFESPMFGVDGLPRRNSSTSNLASNIEAINIQNRTPDLLDQSNQDSSIAARRQKRPTALNSSTLRSASYTSGMSSPGSNGDQTLRRIRSSGIASASGRVQKPTAGPSQRSPMSLTFSEAASSPKFARAFSASSTTTVGGAQGGSLAPPTPQTPNETPRFPYWQSNTVLRNHPTMPDHSSPESLGPAWSMEPSSSGNYSSGTSPPSTPLDLAQLNQARLGQDGLYRDTPPQSAPATQQGFPRANAMQPPQMRAGYHSSTDLTLAQPKPSHFRRPSLPEPGQGQADHSNAMYGGQFGNLSYDDFREVSLAGITHNVPFAPPVSAMPDFLVHQYAPPVGPGSNGAYTRRPNEPQTKNFIFANQGPSDFRS